MMMVSHIYICLPKSGTHMMMRWKKLSPADHIPFNDPETKDGWEPGRLLQEIKKRERPFAGHIPYFKEIAHHLLWRGTRVTLLYRDPRDIAISMYYYVEKVGDVSEFWTEDWDIFKAVKVTSLICQEFTGWFFQPWIRKMRFAELLVEAKRAGLGEDTYTFRRGLVGEWEEFLSKNTSPAVERALSSLSVYDRIWSMSR